MSIFPLPVFEADADPAHRDGLTDAEIYARLKPPTSIVVRFGAMKQVAEYPYEGDAKPGCGSKMVARTHRGTELAIMLTTTCANSGCSKSVSRQEMLEYIENSGGEDYPFHTQGKIVRVATIEDLNRQAAQDATKFELTRDCRVMAATLNLAMKIVDAEPILGGELLTFFYMAEERVDFRELVRQLAAKHKTRIEMRQVGARDEARLTADYERCGQHCCCKNFLKVLKPVSMRSAKIQKATLDPLKISGRCGRLMCCLRYEDQTYEELKAKLPRKGLRVGTSEGPGVVVDGKILVQLVLVRLEHNNEEIAVPVEELMDPEQCPKPSDRTRVGGGESRESDPLRGMSEQEVIERTDEGRRRERQERGGRGRGRRGKHEQQDAFRQGAIDRARQPDEKVETEPTTEPEAPIPNNQGGASRQETASDQTGARRRRRRGRRRGSGGSGGAGEGGGDRRDDRSSGGQNPSPPRPPQ